MAILKNGWLDGVTYGAPARAAWLGVTSYLDANANLRGVCVGTGGARSQNVLTSDPAEQLKYYFDRPRQVGDFHGQAPIVWCASPLLR